MITPYQIESSYPLPNGKGTPYRLVTPPLTKWEGVQNSNPLLNRKGYFKQNIEFKQLEDMLSENRYSDRKASPEMDKARKNISKAIARDL